MMQSFFTLFKQGFVNNFDLILRLKKLHRICGFAIILCTKYDCSCIR